MILFPFPFFFSSFPSFLAISSAPFPSPPSLSFPTLHIPYFASLPLRSSHHFPVPFLSLSLHFSSFRTLPILTTPAPFPSAPSLPSFPSRFSYRRRRPSGWLEDLTKQAVPRAVDSRLRTRGNKKRRNAPT